MQKIIYIIFLIVVISGCSVLKRGKTEALYNGTDAILREAQIEEKNLSNRSFTIQKAEIELDNNGKWVYLIANMRYSREGKYLISIRSKSGIEIGRIFITNDTILANDRVNKKLYYGSARYLESKYGISFGSIPVILGDLMIISERKNEKVECKNGEAKFSERANGRIMDYTVNCDEKKINLAKLNGINGGGSIEIKFRNFLSRGDVTYPGAIEIWENKSQPKIRIEIKKVELDNVEELRFIPGANYEEVMIK
ncbi:MAG: DUF4292 domain-containing protein [Bacteroidia bacterium]|nr:DUF4292 domain-containing protein [Bacteroidia bacterium]